MESGNLLAQNQLLNLEIKRRVDQISAINAVATTVGHSLSLDKTFKTALQAVTDVMQADAAGISLIDHAAQELILRAQLGWIQDFVKSTPMRIPLGEGLSGQVIRNDDSVVLNNLTGREKFAVPSFRKEHFRSIAMAPMHARGEIIGILSVMSHQADSFDPNSIEVLRSIADTVGVAIDNARLYERHVENENKLTAILQSTADGIIATDQQSRITLINHAATQMLNVSADHLLGQPLREVNIPGNVSEQLLNAMHLDAPSSQHTFQVTLAERELSVVVSPVQIISQVDDDSSRDGWVILLQDITHIREAERARMKFIQAAAHDMKNPLSVTQKSLHMLEDIMRQHDEMVLEIFDIARSSILRLQRLLDDLMHIEQIESGQDFAISTVNVREMIDEICAHAKPVMMGSNIRLEAVVEEDIPEFAQLDRNWMYRALQNYLENTTKYAPDGTVILHVFISDGAIHFTVRDNGPGIPLSQQARLFERFYRAVERSSVQGSGLGLAIVKSVAEAHGGTAYVQSEEGMGSEFGIAIPLQDHASSPVI